MGDVAGQLLDAYGYRGEVAKVHHGYRQFYALPA